MKIRAPGVGDWDGCAHVRCVGGWVGGCMGGWMGVSVCWGWIWICVGVSGHETGLGVIKMSQKSTKSTNEACGWHRPVPWAFSSPMCQRESVCVVYWYSVSKSRTQ